MSPRVVLVTGVSRYLGGRVATLLQADPSIERVIGVDTVPPRPEQVAMLGRTEFVRADIRNPLIAKVIAQAQVDTVVHMNVIATPLGAGGRTAMKEINVIGTMQLLAACQKAPSMRKLVVKSTAAVYGSSSRDPGLFTEDVEPRSLPKSGYAKDAVEVEGYVRGFGRRRATRPCSPRTSSRGRCRSRATPRTPSRSRGTSGASAVADPTSRC
ncbi:MAG: NAD-dependent epimerase/dehydratase family protein, partial [Mycobacteriales bacterium]